jgi:hypothetical protein
VQVISIALTILVVLNCWVTVLLWRSSLYSRGQRIAQSVIVWVVPVFGIAAVSYFLREHEPARVGTSGFIDELPFASGDFGVGGGGAHHDSSADVGGGH